MIDSHSSFITNQRVDKQRQRMCDLGEMARANPTLLEVNIQYWAAIDTHICEVWPIFASDSNKTWFVKLLEDMRSAKALVYKIAKTDRQGAKISLDDVLKLNTLADRMHFYTTGMWQNLQYFFRVGKTSTQSIASTLSIFSTDEMWGGKGDDSEWRRRVQDLFAKRHATPAGDGEPLREDDQEAPLDDDDAFDNKPG